MRGSFPLSLLATAALLAACGRSDNGTAAPEATNDGGALTEAPAVPLVNASGAIIGEIRGGDSDTGATLLVTARGLPPGPHGIHIHDVGLCDPPDFKSAGPHWNPTGKKHGGQNPEGAHSGDLQNVTVAEDGSLKAEILVPGTYLRNAGRDIQSGANPILDANGAAVVIHADPDDYKTDPSGNSGARIACAVLGSPQLPAAVGPATDGNAAANATSASTEAEPVTNDSAVNSTNAY